MIVSENGSKSQTTLENAGVYFLNVWYPVKGTSENTGYYMKTKKKRKRGFISAPSFDEINAILADPQKREELKREQEERMKKFLLPTGRGIIL